MRINYNFTKENLIITTNELIKSFGLPEVKFDIELGQKKYKQSGKVILSANPPLIVLYKPYHERFPEEYKVTILHELGHVYVGVEHGAEFYQYYKTLLSRDTDNIIPKKYSGFRYSKPVGNWAQKWCCAICSSIKYYKINMKKSKCNSCSMDRCLDTGFLPVPLMLA